MNRIKRILELFLGFKYYVVVVHRTGTDMYELCSTMFRTKQQVEAYKKLILGNRSFEYVETLSFRSWVDYNNVR